jgi:UDP-2-acetamido-3-amino-2,3-dideoxy-glucuronate N-acetyltransferase
MTLSGNASTPPYGRQPEHKRPIPDRETIASVYVHPTALVDTDQIGAGTRIWAFSHVMEGASVGKNCNIGGHCFIEAGSVVGNNVTIKNGNSIWDGITLEDGVFVGPRVFFTNDLRPRSPRLPQVRGRYSSRSWLVPTLVRNGSSIGAAAIVLAGRTIGQYSLVGAGALVTKDVPAYALVLGSPARIAGWVCQCGETLEFKTDFSTCKVCRLMYTRSDRKVTLSQPGRLHADVSRLTPEIPLLG